ncbi:TPA: hypothetical protein ACH3X2_011483 [Trebouxia sp. C0005]
MDAASTHVAIATIYGQLNANSCCFIQLCTESRRPRKETENLADSRLLRDQPRNSSKSRLMDSQIRPQLNMSRLTVPRKNARAVSHHDATRNLELLNKTEGQACADVTATSAPSSLPSVSSGTREVAGLRVRGGQTTPSMTRVANNRAARTLSPQADFEPAIGSRNQPIEAEEAGQLQPPALGQKARGGSQ